MMSQTYGEGYATRCDEEGYGGTYSGNQFFSTKNQTQQSTQGINESGFLLDHSCIKFFKDQNKIYPTI